MKRVIRYGLILAALLLMVGIAAAQSANSVVVQFNWIYNNTWSGFFLATDEGYYADQGLKAEFRTVFDENGNFRDVIDEVASGRAQFAVTDSGTFFKAREAGIPVIAIATIYQRHPLALLSLAEKNIVSPEDLIGKTVHISGNSTVMFETLLRFMDIDPSEVTVVERTDYTPGPITSGKADVIDAWVINEAALLSIQGVAFNAIYPFEYGVDMYPNLIITSEKLAAESPDMVQRFLKATLMGYQSAVDNPQKAAETTVAWGDNLVYEEQLEGFYRSIPLIVPAGSRPGMMEPEMWELGHEILLEAGVIKKDVDVESCYTLKFLEAIYGK